MPILKRLYKTCSKINSFKKFERIMLNEYLIQRYHITIDHFETWMKNCEKIQKVKVDDYEFKFVDTLASTTIDIVSEELASANVYDFSKLNFKKGDIVIDIGANIGMISIYLAKKFPFLKIYSFEPVTQNYNNFLTNIKLNDIPEGVIFPYNMAVTSDGRNVDMSINTHNYGGSSISDVIAVGAVTQDCNLNIPSTTLQQIFKQNSISELALLKIDCEGSEYEILYNTPKEILQKINILRGEFHENKSLTDQYDTDQLLQYVQTYIKDIKIEHSRNCFVM